MASPLHRWFGSLDLPREGGKVDPAHVENALRLRLLSLVFWLCLVLGSMWALSFFLYGAVHLAVAFLTGVLVLLCVFVLGKKLGHPPLISHLILLIFLMGVVLANFGTGGLARANSVLYFVLALMGIFLLGRGGVLWVGVSALALVAFLAMHAAGFEFPDAVLPEQRLLDMGLTLFFSLVVLLGVAGYYELYRRLSLIQLLEAKSKVEQASEARRAFLAKASHELRTPLNAILGLCELMHTDVPNDTCARHLTAVKQSALALRRLVNDLLDVSRIDASKLQLHPVPFEPRRLLTEVAEELQPRARARGLELSFDISGDVPARLLADTLRLRQIVVNLVDNAIKYTPAGRVDVRVRPAETVGLCLRVQDTGPGIPPDLMPHLFEPFLRAKDSGGVDGSGLGLHITQQLCQVMGGSIRAENLPAGGAAFEVTLPLPAAPEASTGRRILAAEDDPVSRMLVQTILQRKGYQVECVCDGNAVVEAVAAARPDLILMDVGLPGMDGMEAARRIRQTEGASPAAQRVPIVAMTAHVLSEERDRCFAAGMDDFIGKPVQAAELLQTVERWLAAERKTPTNP